MQITLITVGKLKEKFYQEAVKEYSKRLTRYAKIHMLEVPDEKTPDGASAVLEEQIKEKEGMRILSNIKEGSYVIALAIQGKSMASPAFAQQLEKLATYGTSHIVFVIGGSLGLHTCVLQRADFLLSFSDMTFPHQLMRVILLEQIYRGFRIMKNEPYHK